MESVDVAVVGLGLAGAAAAWELSRRGRSVAAFEAYAPGHRNGSSHGSARIFRRAYLDPLYVELTGRAGTLWDRLGEEAGESLLVRTGGVDHGRGREPERMARLLNEHGVAAELFTADEAAARWPGVTFDGPVVHDPEGGVLDPERTMAALVRLAVAAGAQVFYESPVLGLEPDDQGVRIRTDQGTWSARTVVVAAGAWAGSLLSGLVDLSLLTVSQQQVLFFRPREPIRWPTIVHDAELPIYALPEGPYFKVGEHATGTVTTPTARDFVVDPAARERLVQYVRKWLPGLDPVPVRELTCLYTSTPDEDFVLYRQGPFVVCSACSGHGAKFTPLIGELVADLVDGHPPIGRFALPRR
ncbi:N-methyl-L-tryptophan oxidase [Actinomadura scrupuli]|uniref:N-methyl-L-tryptophan oxidase n=1 Tax=Actinomadura scrupuli TaxID=559629 RepID=UPI003D98CD2B